MAQAKRSWLKPAVKAVGHAAAWTAGFLARSGVSLLKRGYALGLMVLILWVSYRAVAYLVVSLAVSTPTPAQITGVPKRLEDSLLHGRRPDWLGLQAVENPRSPLAHYHRFDSWIEDDRVNDCTRSGCHGPLPHTRRKEVRAFLNMHATSLHCGVCHMQTEQKPLPLLWYDLASGERRAPPALLQADAWLNDHAAAAARDKLNMADQARIVGLLLEASREADGDPALQRSARHLKAVSYSSPAFARLLDTAIDHVRRAFRGSYGAKLALRGAGDRPVLAHPGTQAAIERFLREGAAADEAQRRVLLDAVHPQKRPAPLHCTDCHRQTGSLVDFAAVGYSPQRIRTLFDPAIFQMIEHIGAGTPFHLPRVLGPGDAATQPAPPPPQP